MMTQRIRGIEGARQRAETVAGPVAGRCYKAIVLGVSTGGVEALKFLAIHLPKNLAVPLLVVLHLSPDSDDGLAHLLDGLARLRVKEADDGELPLAGSIYLAPPNYHLQVEPDGRLSLSMDLQMNYARPSVDVLFETASLAWGPALIGVILTGAGRDGANGLKQIQERGGTVLIQDPMNAEMDSMPKGALALLKPDYVITLASLPQLLVALLRGSRSKDLDPWKPVRKHRSSSSTTDPKT